MMGFVDVSGHRDDDSTVRSNGGQPPADGGAGERAASAPRSTRAGARRAREREIVDATRRLFDERGMQDAPIEDIARAVGINKALIYRHFSSKDELFVLTVTRYLTELAERFAEVDESLDPVTQLRQVSERYVRFCLDYPAFIDCSLSLMRRPFAELAETVSEGVLLRLGQGMAACLSRLSRILAAGAEQGVFSVDEPDMVANMLYAQGLGAMQLARVGAGVSELTAGVPRLFAIDPEQLARAAVDTAFAYVLSPQPVG
jgi:AcrR family transcriptional regulator